MLPDFSYAGYRYQSKKIPTVEGPLFNVVDYGADPTGVKCVQIHIYIYSMRIRACISDLPCIYVHCAYPTRVKYT